MADAFWTRDGADDGWGPATSVRSSGADTPAPRPSHARAPRPPRGSQPDAASYADAPAPWDSGALATTEAPAAAHGSQSALEQLTSSVANAGSRRGIPGWAALLVQVAITVIGILIDSVRGEQLSNGFNIGIIVGSVVSILVVRRSGMFPVVIAPPIVYSLGAGISLYLRSGGLHDRGVLIDAATNWLVYGFPAIAAATAVVLIGAGIRMITRR